MFNYYLLQGHAIHFLHIWHNLFLRVFAKVFLRKSKVQICISAISLLTIVMKTNQYKQLIISEKQIIIIKL